MKLNPYVRDSLTLLNTKKGYQTLKTEKKKLNVLKELNSSSSEHSIENIHL